MKQFFFTIGSDPEVFIQDKKTNKFISAVGKIGGTKEKPLSIDFKGNKLLEDNVAVEFNTAVAQDYITFKKMVYYNLESINNMLPDYNISKVSAAIFTDDELNTPQAQLFGCEPDYNAWTQKKNKKPFSENANLRSAGGHIHIGSLIAIKDPIKLVKACDLFLGIPSILMDPDSQRRELYGKAGAYRKKPFGVEYRTLSNFWIFSEETILWVYTQVSKALTFVADGNVILEKHANLIQDCINKTDRNSIELLNECYNIYD